jgi:hypothetical protein
MHFLDACELRTTFAVLIQKDGGIGPFDVLATGDAITLGATFHPTFGKR